MGERAVVGAGGDGERAPNAGAAYIVVEIEDGGWDFAQKLFAADGGRDEFFGSATGTNDSQSFVGAKRHGVAGAVYVFEADDEGSWHQTQKLLPCGATLGALFGDALAVHRDILIGGAHHDNVRFDNDGAAYVFELDEDGSWVQTARLAAPDPSDSDFFGIGVAVSGETIVVGACNDDDRGTNAGAAYVFDRGEDGAWRFTVKLLADDGDAGDEFGRFVAIDGDRILLGANQDADNGEDSGSVYVFERAKNDAWWQTAKILPTDGEAGQRFGISVAVEGRRALIGALGDDQRGRNAGAAYVFDLTDDGTWIQRAKMTASGSDEEDRFGSAVAMSGDTVVVGASHVDDNGDESGAAYVFDLAPLTPDLDGDEDVDLDDYALFASCITGPDGAVRAICTPADLDCDNDVDLTDYTRFSSALP